MLAQSSGNKVNSVILPRCSVLASIFVMHNIMVFFHFGTCIIIMVFFSGICWEPCYFYCYYIVLLYFLEVSATSLLFASLLLEISSVDV